MTGYFHFHFFFYLYVFGYIHDTKLALFPEKVLTTGSAGFREGRVYSGAWSFVITQPGTALDLLNPWRSTRNAGQAEQQRLGMKKFRVDNQRQEKLANEQR